MSEAAETDEIADDGGSVDTRAAGPLAVLEPALWRQLNEAETIADLSSAWLALQCRMIDGAGRGIVRVERNGALETICNWPEQGAVLTDLTRTGDLAASERRAVARGGSNGKPGSIALPIIIDERVAAVVALGIEAADKAAMRDAIRQLQWGAAWLRDGLRHQRGLLEGEQLDRSRMTVDLIATVVEHEKFATAVTAAATDLATRFDCARVSIGFVRNGSAHVAAISHTAQFGRQMKLVRLVGAAMDEAIDQRSVVLYPAPPEAPIAALAHQDLAREHNLSQALTIPLFVVDRFAGAITFERTHERPFDAQTIALADVMATTIGPLLEEKRRNDRWLIVKAAESFVGMIKRLLGPGYIGRKLAVAAALAVIAFFAVAHDTYRVTADAQLDGAVRRSIVSPYDGYLQSADVRAGELVKQGQVLAALDDRDLVLERLRWDTERQQHQLEYDQALAARQPAAVNTARARIAQAEAQIKLIDEQIARLKFTAPFDGLVISGDLSERIGGAVSRGEVLYEIAPLTNYRVVVQVDEHLVGDVVPGQTGNVVFSAIPDQPFPMVVDKIVPVAQVHDGRNILRVEAHLTESSDRLRPGMAGVGKIDIGERRLIDIWAKPLVDWVSLTLWRDFG
jgi:RND family efflux transporter MFP subunit